MGVAGHFSSVGVAVKKTEESDASHSEHERDFFIGQDADAQDDNGNCNS